MPYSKSEHILCSNIDILIKVMSMLDAEDQLALTQVHDNIEKAFLEYIWKRKFNLDTNIIEFNENFKTLIDKNGKKLSTLSVRYGQVEFNPSRLEALENLTEIRINMARMAINLEILKLENIDYKNLDCKKLRRFKLEFLKTLQLPHHSQLQMFIDDCSNLEELIINDIPECFIRSLTHSLISHDILKSTLNDIRIDQASVSEDIGKINTTFDIIAKINQTTIVQIYSFYMILPLNCEKYIKHFNMLHLNSIKELRLNCFFEHSRQIEFMKLLSKNCTQLKILEYSGRRSLIRSLNTRTLVNLIEMPDKFTRPESGDNLFHILKDLSLESCEFNWNLSCNAKSTQNYGNSIKVLKCHGLFAREQNLETFFQLYPNGFQNLKELTLYGFKSVERMLELALKHFHNIKYLNIKSGPINEKTLATLIQFSILKYLKIEADLINQEQIDYLQRHIHRVIV